MVSIRKNSNTMKTCIGAFFILAFTLIFVDGRTTPRNPWITWNGFVNGTKWCGRGNRATPGQRYGWHIAADRCCESHDFCTPKIGKWETKYGYFNWRLFTISHCNCDAAYVLFSLTLFTVRCSSMSPRYSHGKLSVRAVRSFVSLRC